VTRLFLEFQKENVAALVVAREDDFVSVGGDLRVIEQDAEGPKIGDGSRRAAGKREAEKKLRKVKGYRELKDLAQKLNPHSTPLDLGHAPWPHCAGGKVRRSLTGPESKARMAAMG
jgi:hypothetical protein